MYVFTLSILPLISGWAQVVTLDSILICLICNIRKQSNFVLNLHFSSFNLRTDHDSPTNPKWHCSEHLNPIVDHEHRKRHEAEDDCPEEIKSM